MCQLGAFLRKSLVVEFPRSHRVETQVELVLPSELKPRLAQSIVTRAGGWMPFGQIRRVGRNLVGNDSILDVLFVRQTEMLLWRHVTEHGTAVPTDHGGANGAGDVVITGSDVGRQRT